MAELIELSQVEVEVPVLESYISGAARRHASALVEIAALPNRVVRQGQD